MSYDDSFPPKEAQFEKEGNGVFRRPAFRKSPLRALFRSSRFTESTGHPASEVLSKKRYFANKILSPFMCFSAEEKQELKHQQPRRSPDRQTPDPQTASKFYGNNPRKTFWRSKSPRSPPVGRKGHMISRESLGWESEYKNEDDHAASQLEQIGEQFENPKHSLLIGEIHLPGIGPGKRNRGEAVDCELGARNFCSGHLNSPQMTQFSPLRKENLVRSPSADCGSPITEPSPSEGQSFEAQNQEDSIKCNPQMAVHNPYITCVGNSVLLHPGNLPMLYDSSMKGKYPEASNPMQIERCLKHKEDSSMWVVLGRDKTFLRRCRYPVSKKPDMPGNENRVGSQKASNLPDSSCKSGIDTGHRFPKTSPLSDNPENGDSVAKKLFQTDWVISTNGMKLVATPGRKNSSLEIPECREVLSTVPCTDDMAAELFNYFESCNSRTETSTDWCPIIHSQFHLALARYHQEADGLTDNRVLEHCKQGLIHVKGLEEEFKGISGELHLLFASALLHSGETRNLSAVLYHAAIAQRWLRSTHDSLLEYESFVLAGLCYGRIETEPLCASIKKACNCYQQALNLMKTHHLHGTRERIKLNARVARLCIRYAEHRRQAMKARKLGVRTECECTQDTTQPYYQEIFSLKERVEEIKRDILHLTEKAIADRMPAELQRLNSILCELEGAYWYERFKGGTEQPRYVLSNASVSYGKAQKFCIRGKGSRRDHLRYWQISATLDEVNKKLERLRRFLPEDSLLQREYSTKP